MKLEFCQVCRRYHEHPCDTLTMRQQVDRESEEPTPDTEGISTEEFNRISDHLEATGQTAR